jgi:D-glycero-D-manno-heptose 1,7-bisphosphate phosphatase
MPVAAVFVDKDGTLVENVPYNVDPARVALTQGAAPAIHALRQNGFQIFVVSNQPGVGLGYFHEKDLKTVEAILRQRVHVDDFYWCLHAPDAGCDCRKPLPGMLLRAAKEHGVDLASSWMVGDILDDVEAGRRAGCRTCLIDNGNETEWKRGEARTPDCVAADLEQAAKLILQA